MQPEDPYDSIQDIDLSTYENFSITDYNEFPGGVEDPADTRWDIDLSFYEEDFNIMDNSNEEDFFNLDGLPDGMEDYYNIDELGEDIDLTLDPNMPVGSEPLLDRSILLKTSTSNSLATNAPAYGASPVSCQTRMRHPLAHQH
ncbi:hypothetical protein ElyMa_006490500 [Elysia marginata]|uniref:Uncharacterized protein n=1 Tax=Elysia marginata TaxID=1093978 RepID=A0AAV4I3Z2_9GAST|nr:hypothetical protein ElyMa_006490500 [Elysia marginata]